MDERLKKAMEAFEDIYKMAVDLKEELREIELCAGSRDENERVFKMITEARMDVAKCVTSADCGRADISMGRRYINK